LALATSSSNYDSSKGEQMALNVDGSKSTKNPDDKLYSSGYMDKQVIHYFTIIN